ncbi:hypothetical protein TYRP_010215 [Tyrophagus putrescentiae]|nr:hypothetical protein TYRP_010215 [Tyrophagus putrescentiae]
MDLIKAICILLLLILFFLSCVSACGLSLKKLTGALIELVKMIVFDREAPIAFLPLSYYPAHPIPDPNTMPVIFYN